MIKLKFIISAIALTVTANAGWVTTIQSATDKSIETEKRQLATYEAA